MKLNSQIKQKRSSTKPERSKLETAVNHSWRPDLVKAVGLCKWIGRTFWPLGKPTAKHVKWVNFTKLKRWQTVYIHGALRSEGGKYLLVMPRWRLTRWCLQRKFPLSFERFALLEDKGFPKSAICSGIQTSRQLLYAGCIHCNSYRWLLGQVLHHIYKESTDEVESIRLQRIALDLCGEYYS